MRESREHRPSGTVLKFLEARFAPFIEKRTQQTRPNQSPFPSPQHNGLGCTVRDYLGLQCRDTLCFNRAVLAELTDRRSNPLVKSIRAKPRVPFADDDLRRERQVITYERAVTDTKAQWEALVMWSST